MGLFNRSNSSKGKSKDTATDLPGYQAEKTNSLAFESLKSEIETVENEIWPDDVTKAIAVRYQETTGIRHVRETDPKVGRIGCIGINPQPELT
jgi:hypothetical protein